MSRIKRFLKYKGFPYVKTLFKNRAKIKIPSLFLFAGVGLLGTDYWNYIFCFLTKATSTFTPLDIGVSITTKVVGLALIVFAAYWAHRLMANNQKNSQEKAIVTVKQFSIDSSEKNFISSKPKKVQYIHLDQRRLDGESRMEWIRRSIIQQKEIINDTHYVVERWDQPTLHYEGLAHIPFVFLLGYQLSDKRKLLFLEWDENKKKWGKLPQSIEGNYPPLEMYEKVNESKQEAKDVTILVSLTTEIHHFQLEGMDAYNYNHYHLKLSNCKRHAIVCLDQLNEYKEQFRNLIDNIKPDYPRLKRVHVFISAQTSLVFNLGSSLNRNDAEFWVYNFEINSTIQYPWGLRAHKNISKDKLNEQINIIMGEENA
ncbi:SAVED domain-containing protein [Sporosarcina sp. G11-34]|uniref:SAVED domain-containing protein n=1 Tax=Sporosarcina sp. G11-34 TaxID=2849605 RepID=UPI0022A8EB41|nr:SAVED domain-containing protein [Sporosarcina sp. G11-34]MCZ2259421.1 SAVED domain-containing protein [Sporosarcina sp. G11-34]